MPSQTPGTINSTVFSRDSDVCEKYTTRIKDEKYYNIVVAFRKEASKILSIYENWYDRVHFLKRSTVKRTILYQK